MPDAIEHNPGVVDVCVSLGDEDDIAANSCHGFSSVLTPRGGDASNIHNEFTFVALRVRTTRALGSASVPRP